MTWKGPRSQHTHRHTHRHTHTQHPSRDGAPDAAAPDRRLLSVSGIPIPAAPAQPSTLPASPPHSFSVAAKAVLLGTATRSSDRVKATGCPLPPGETGHLPFLDLPAAECQAEQGLGGGHGVLSCSSQVGVAETPPAPAQP